MRRMERKAQAAAKQNGGMSTLTWEYKNQVWTATMPTCIANDAVASLVAAGYKAKVE